jgi:hypothetical protein
MLGWLRSMFGGGKPAEHNYPLVREVPGKGPSAPPPVSPEPQEAPAEALVDQEQGAFLTELVAPRPEINLQGLAPEDRLFVSGVLKKVREKQLDVPVLPQAAMQISKLLADPNSDARGFAKVLEADPALSVDVLRIANSAYYGFAQQTTSVKDAVIRIGLTQLRGLIVVTHLQGKILQTGVFRREAEWVVDLSMAVAQLAQSLAQPLGLGKDQAFTRGVLSHVEHFIIMGAVAEISREHQKRLQPTRGALLDTIQLCGENVRRLAGDQWQLGTLMDGDAADGEAAPHYRQLRAALVADWCALDTQPAVDGVEETALARALGALRKTRGDRTGA